MLSNVLRLIIAIAALLGSAACSESFKLPNELQPDAPGAITIHLKNLEMSRSEASDNSEFKITNLYIGLYENDADENTPAVKLISRTDLSVSNTYTVTIPLTYDLTMRLFDNGKDGAKCKFFIIANIPDATDLPDNPTITEMKELRVESDFAEEQVQPSFVMASQEKDDITGEYINILTYTAPKGADKEGKARGETKLIRAAAKIRLNVGFPKKITVTNENGVEETWTPVLNSNTSPVTVLINNGVTNAVSVPESKPVLSGGGGGIDDQPVYESWRPDSESDYYSSNLKDVNEGDNKGSCRIMIPSTLTPTEIGWEENAKYPDIMIMDVPFYSYPNWWTESVEETIKTSLTLIVTWQKEGTEGEKTMSTFYYQVPVTSEYATSLSRNHSYTINLNVGMLGSLTREVPLKVEASYNIVEWNDFGINVSIPENRYLVVSPDKYIINNDSVISIPFYTSHPVIIEKLTMSYERFNYPANGSGEVQTIEMNKEIIDRSTFPYPLEEGEVGDTICRYSIIRDPITNVMTLQIIHPMIMWVPLDKSGNPVSLIEQSESIDDQVGKIDRYAYPERNVYPLPDNEMYTGASGYYTPQTAYFPYKFQVTIRHSDNTLFTHTINITQYPGMYIEANKNTGGKYLSYDSEGYYYDKDNPQTPLQQPAELQYGYTYLNPKKMTVGGKIVWRNADITWYGDAEDWDSNLKKSEIGADAAKKIYIDYNTLGLGGLRPYKGSEADGVSNPNMYVINITQLSENDSKYIIGNPRASYINNDLSGNTPLLTPSEEEALEWCEPAQALYEDEAGGRRLRYYYPTREDSEAEMIVAPKLRVSSAYGFVRRQNMIIDRSIGRRRAATYQEQGYPAGRWRLPTKGEVEFIVKLSAQKKIPELFKTGYYYLTAQGAFYVNANGTLSEKPTELDINVEWTGTKWNQTIVAMANVRPVYDEWYWEHEENYVLEPNETGAYIYTLGDKPSRSN